MKHVIIVFVLFASVVTFGQSYVGIKSGPVDMEQTTLGLNLEVHYDREVIKNLYVGVLFGNSSTNNFPNFFENVQPGEAVDTKGLSPRVHEYILGLDRDDVPNRLNSWTGFVA